MKFVHPPEFIPLSRYEQLLTRYVDIVSQESSVVQIFSMGSISAPGLSDIDIIVVVDDEPKKIPLLSVSQFGMDRRLFLHDVFVVNSSLFSNFEQLLVPTNLKLLFTRRQNFASGDIDNRVSKELVLMQLVDLNRMRVRQLVDDAYLGECNIRHFITRASSIKHSIEMCNQLGIKLADAVIGHGESMKTLRQQWTESKGAVLPDIPTLFDENLSAFIHIVERAAVFLQPLVDLDTNINNMKIRLADLDFCDDNRCIIHPSDNPRRGQVLWPFAFRFHYDGYANSRSGPYHCAQRVRYRTVQAHIRFLEKYGFGFSMRGNVGIPTNTKAYMKIFTRKISGLLPDSKRMNAEIRITKYRNP